MTKLKIKKFSVNPLRVEEVFGFLKQVQAEAKACFSGSDSESPDEINLQTSSLLKTTLGTFNNAIDGYDAALKESASIPSASVASGADAERDLAWRGINAYAKAMTAHPTEGTRTAAVEVKALFDKYGDPTSLSQTEESGVLHNLIQDLQVLPAEKRTALALDVWIADLGGKEEAFLAAMQQRTSDQSARVIGIVKQSRQVADAAYDKLVDTVNALALLEGEAAYATFIDHVNVLIDQQRTVLKTRATLNAKKAAQTPPVETK
ncbi:MAG: DUF6261 family protein [Parabacteroides sp.]|nr:DUF6261 family protein [Parabacteroides sp.]